MRSWSKKERGLFHLFRRVMEERNEELETLVDQLGGSQQKERWWSDHKEMVRT